MKDNTYTEDIRDFGKGLGKDLKEEAHYQSERLDTDTGRVAEKLLDPKTGIAVAAGTAAGGILSGNNALFELGGVAATSQVGANILSMDETGENLAERARDLRGYQGDSETAAYLDHSGIGVTRVDGDSTGDLQNAGVKNGFQSWYDGGIESGLEFTGDTVLFEDGGDILGVYGVENEGKCLEVDESAEAFRISDYSGQNTAAVTVDDEIDSGTYSADELYDSAREVSADMNEVSGVVEF